MKGFFNFLLLVRENGFVEMEGDGGGVGFGACGVLMAKTVTVCTTVKSGIGCAASGEGGVVEWLGLDLVEDLWSDGLRKSGNCVELVVGCSFRKSDALDYDPSGLVDVVTHKLGVFLGRNINFWEI